MCFQEKVALWMSTTKSKLYTSKKWKQIVTHSVYYCFTLPLEEMWVSNFPVGKKVECFWSSLFANVYDLIWCGVLWSLEYLGRKERDYNVLFCTEQCYSTEQNNNVASGYNQCFPPTIMKLTTRKSFEMACNDFW